MAQALSARGYQSFVVDYRLRPYTQQEGALDLARAVRFVRAHAEDYGIDPADIAVMGFSAGGILSGEMLLHFDGTVNGTALDPDYAPDALDQVSADGAACGMIYAFTAASAWAPPTWTCFARAACPHLLLLRHPGPLLPAVPGQRRRGGGGGGFRGRLRLDGMPHGFGAQGDWIPTYDQWLTTVFSQTS